MRRDTSSQECGYNLTRHIGEAEIPALVAISQPFMVQTKEV